MSDLIKKVIKKMQEGGSVTYRGGLTLEPSRLIYSPEAMQQQAGGGSRRKSSGSSGSTSKGSDGPEMYKSSKDLLRAESDNLNMRINQLQSNTVLSPEDKAIRYEQMVAESAKRSTAIIEHGTQSKADFDEYAKNASNLDAVGYEPIVIPNIDRPYNPDMIVTDTATGNFAVVPLSVLADNMSTLKPLTVQQGSSLFKNNSAFMAFLNKNQITDFAATLRGTVSRDAVDDAAVKTFEKSSITAGQDGNTFLMGGREYESAELAVSGEDGPNRLTRSFLQAASIPIKARVAVEIVFNNGGSGGGELSEVSLYTYLNEYLPMKAGIDIPTTKASEYSAIPSSVRMLAAGPTGVDNYMSISKVPGVTDIDSDETKERINRTTINIARQTASIPNYAAELTGKYKSEHGEFVPLVKSEYVNSLALNGGALEPRFVAGGQKINEYHVDKDGIGMSTKASDRMISGAQIRTDLPAQFTWGVGLSSGNGEASPELERAIATVNMIQRGYQDSQNSAVPGLAQKWAAEDDLEDYDSYKAANKDVLILKRKQAYDEAIKSVDKSLTGEELAIAKQDAKDIATNTIRNYIEAKVVKLNQNKIQSKSNRDILKGNALKDFFLRQGMKEDEATAQATNYKQLLANKYVIVPQLLVRIDMPVYDSGTFDAYKELVQEGYLPDSDVTTRGQGLFTSNQFTNDQLVRFPDPSIEGIVTTPVLIDLNASSVALEAFSRDVRGEEFNPSDPKTAKEIQELADKYGKPQPLTFDLFNNLPWLNPEI